MTQPTPTAAPPALLNITLGVMLALMLGWFFHIASGVLVPMVLGLMISYVVMADVMVYGFGSAFVALDGSETSEQDVDLLIVHPSTHAASCQFAIVCKRRLAACIANAHITMLSAREEQHFQFIRTARTVHLGSIRADHITDDLRTISAAVPILGKF